MEKADCSIASNTRTEQKVDSLLFSVLQVYDSHDETIHSGRSERKPGAKDNPILHAGTGVESAPTSQSSSDTFGSADEHLQLFTYSRSWSRIESRSLLPGFDEGPEGPGGIERHVESTLVALKRIRPLALDLGIRLAIENHAGDLHSRELKELQKELAPILLNTLIQVIRPGPWRIHWKPFEICLPMQFAVEFATPWFGPVRKGVKVQWTAMGEGCVDLKLFLRNGSCFV